jgi:Ca2+-binding RTX toxin-like protein
VIWAIRVPAALLAVAWILQALVVGASERVTCAFDASGTKTLSVTAEAPLGPVTMVRAGTEIQVLEDKAQVSCSGAEPHVDTVDAVRIVDRSIGSIEFILDLGSGPFAPGSSLVDPGEREIEVTVDLRDGAHDTVTVLGAGGPDQIELTDAGINLNADSDADDLVTLDVDEHALFGGAGGDSIDGGGAIEGQGFEGRLSISGGEDWDELTGGVSGDTLEGGPGIDELAGGDGADDLFGRDGGDTIQGGRGSDFLDGGDGPDIEEAGDGDDTFDQGSAQNGADQIVGGGGTDAVAFDRRSSPVGTTLDGVADDGEAGELDNVGSDVEGVLGGSGADDLSGDGSANFFDGGAGPDTIEAGGGGDNVTGGPGADELTGGAGQDVVNYFGAPNGMIIDLRAGTTSGVHGPDTLGGFENASGTVHDDGLVGDQEANHLIGRGGTDRLAGGAGADELDGGTSRDRLSGQEGPDRMIGGPGRDVVDLSGAAGPVTIDLDAGSADGEGVDVLTGIEDAVGGGGADVLFGDVRANRLIGLAGSDRILGRGGNDELKGKTGNDDLRGGRGDDRLDGGLGRDRCTQGPGSGTEIRCES